MKLDCNNLYLAYLSGTNNVSNYAQIINKLNIFPVPDGDTGTNMVLTLTKTMAKLKEVKNEINSITDFFTLFNDTAVMNARGNSGVILSQILGGMHKYLIDQKLEELTSFHLARSFQAGKEQAYLTVMQPVEGTILTIIRELAEQTVTMTRLKNMPLLDFLDQVVVIAEATLKNTPNLLLVLKETGVVDSGAYGLVTFFKGIHAFVKTANVIAIRRQIKNKDDALVKKVLLQSTPEVYGYCVETIIQLDLKIWQEKNLTQIKNVLQEQGGRSIVTALNRKILKIHVHILIIGSVLTFLQQFGEFEQVKIDNMTLQSKKHKLTFKGQLTFRHAYAFVVVVPSYELARYFNVELNVPNVVVAGKLMNPTTQDLLDAFEKTEAAEIFLLPNNKNTFLVSEKAVDLESNATVRVIKTTSVAEAMSIIINYDPTQSIRKNFSQMRILLRHFTVIKITQASKTTKINNVVCQENDFIFLHNDKIIYAYHDFALLFKKKISNFIDKHSEIVTIFVADHALSKNRDLIRQVLEDDYNLEYEFIEAGDMVYQFILCIE